MLNGSVVFGQQLIWVSDYLKIVLFVITVFAMYKSYVKISLSVYLMCSLCHFSDMYLNLMCSFLQGMIDAVKLEFSLSTFGI